MKVVELTDAVTAILERPAMRRNRKLRDQIVDALDSAAANIEEGFEQGTDRSFAHFLTNAKGSVGELVGHFRRARRKGCISPEELAKCHTDLEEIGRMLGGFIKYLNGCDWNDRGRHRAPDE